MYVMFQLRPFTVHNVFTCFYGPNKVIIIIIITMKTGFGQQPFPGRSVGEYYVRYHILVH